MRERLIVSGKVVEVFDRDGLTYAKVSLKPCCIEVVADLAQEMQLGEEVVLDLRITATRLRHPATGRSG